MAQGQHLFTSLGVGGDQLVLTDVILVQIFFLAVLKEKQMEKKREKIAIT
jgi:hypothetical protein